MSNLNLHNYNIAAENEAASILSHFDSDTILSILLSNLERKDNIISNSVNIVQSLEQNFKSILANVPSEDKVMVEAVREETYMEIIRTVSNFYNLDINTEGDIYSIAYYVTDLLVHKFAFYLVDFMSKFLITEKNSIYESLDLQRFKKNKDSSTNYGKKIFKDTKLAVILANMDYVLDNMSTVDIDIGQIIHSVYQKAIANELQYVILANDNFFNNHYINTLKGIYRDNYITEIRLYIQSTFMTQQGGINDEQ